MLPSIGFWSNYTCIPCETCQSHFHEFLVKAVSLDAKHLGSSNSYQWCFTTRAHTTSNLGHLDLLFMFTEPLSWISCESYNSWCQTPRIIKLSPMMLYYNNSLDFESVWPWRTFQGHRATFMNFSWRLCLYAKHSESSNAQQWHITTRACSA